jgi:hypothetical protein
MSSRSPFVRGLSSPLSRSFTKIFRTSPTSRQKASRRPSGDHEGNSSIASAKVI